MKKTYILIGFLVIALSSVVGFGTYFISSSYMALDQQAVNEARAMLVKQLTYYPIEGVDFNILSMVESTLPNNTDVSILSSNSSQISNDGTITYENEPTTATVTVKIRKRRSSVTEQITIIIPAITETDDTDNSIDSDTDADDGSATTDTSTGDTTTVDNTTINDIMPTGALNVTSYGANGSDQTDDTAAINSAITAAYNKGGGVVWVPGGTYMINSSGYTGILMKNNVNLLLSSSAKLKQIDSTQYNTAVVRFRGVSNASISGGEIIGKRSYHEGANNESAHGISIQGSNHITVSNIYIHDCWGDGIYIANNSSGLSYNDFVLIDNVVSDNNYRQGLSVVANGTRNTIVRNSTFSNSNGNSEGPNDGIDIEPSYPTAIVDMTIENCRFINNGRSGRPRTGNGSGGYGISIALGASYWHKTSWKITLTNNSGYGNINGLTSAFGAYRNNYTVINSNFGKTAASYTNMFTNPNFSGTSGWSVAGAGSSTTSGGILTVTPTGNTVSISQTSTTSAMLDHLYYYSMDVKATASTLYSIKPTVTGGVIFPGGHADGAAGALASAGTNYWFKIGGVIKSSTIGLPKFTTTVAYSSYGGTLQFKNPKAIDLTARFGAGNEPSDAECYELFP